MENGRTDQNITRSHALSDAKNSAAAIAFIGSIVFFDGVTACFQDARTAVIKIP